MKKLFSRLAIIIVLAATLWGGFLPIAQAQDGTTSQGIFSNLSEQCYSRGSCTLCDVLVVLINISNTILRFFAVIAVIFFIWGAGHLMISSGNEQMVTKGKGIIKATIVGTIIVLASWQIMALVVMVLANENIFEPDTKSKNPIATWYEVAERCAANQ